MLGEGVNLKLVEKLREIEANLQLLEQLRMFRENQNDLQKIKKNDI
jgi:cell fate (sporulation/competence/biofilm development) regulator YlbF (YheA/YmcA/DUF963 family)